MIRDKSALKLLREALNSSKDLDVLLKVILNNVRASSDAFSVPMTDAVRKVVLADDSWKEVGVRSSGLYGVKVHDKVILAGVYAVLDNGETIVIPPIPYVIDNAGKNIASKKMYDLIKSMYGKVPYEYQAVLNTRALPNAMNAINAPGYSVKEFIKIFAKASEKVNKGVINLFRHLGDWSTLKDFVKSAFGGLPHTVKTDSGENKARVTVFFKGSPDNNMTINVRASNKTAEVLVDDYELKGVLNFITAKYQDKPVEVEDPDVLNSALKKLSRLISSGGKALEKWALNAFADALSKNKVEYYQEKPNEIELPCGLRIIAHVNRITFIADSAVPDSQDVFDAFVDEVSKAFPYDLYTEARSFTYKPLVRLSTDVVMKGNALKVIKKALSDSYNEIARALYKVCKGQ